MLLAKRAYWISQINKTMQGIMLVQQQGAQTTKKFFLTDLNKKLSPYAAILSSYSQLF